MIIWCIVISRVEIFRIEIRVRLGWSRWCGFYGFGFTRPVIPSGEGILIEDDVACDYDGSGRWIPESVTLGTRFIPNEDHDFGFRLQLINPRFLVCVDVGFAAKHSKIRDVRLRTVPNRCDARSELRHRTG